MSKTENEVTDASGMPWDERIHTRARTMASGKRSGCWKYKPKTDQAVIAQVESELRGDVVDGDTYKAWRERMGLSHTGAAEELGFCRRTSLNYQNGSTADIPKSITKLCAMLERDKLVGL